MLHGKKNIIALFILITAFFILFLINGNSYIDLNIEVSNPIELTVFYDNHSKTYKFDEKHRTKGISIPIKKQQIKIEIPKKSMNYLRFDFDGPVSTINISKIVLHYNFFKEHALLGDTIKKAFPIKNDIVNIEKHENFISLEMDSGGDCFIATDKPITCYYTGLGVSIKTLLAVLGYIICCIAIYFTWIFKHYFIILFMKIQKIYNSCLRNKYSLVLLILLLTGIFYFLMQKANSYHFLVLLMAFLFALSIISSAKYLISGIIPIRHFIFLIICLLFVMEPLLLNGFYFGDDHWGIGNKNLNFIMTSGISMRRPLIGVIGTCFSDLTFETSNLFRATNISILLLFILVFFQFLVTNGNSFIKAKLICVVLFCSTIGVDLIAYLSIYPAVYSLLLELIAFIELNNLINTSGCSIVSYVLRFLGCLVLLIGAFCLYNIITPVFFVFMVIILLNENKELLIKRILYYGGFYGVSAFLYLALSSFFMKYYTVYGSQNARSEIIHNIPALFIKAKWFIKAVIPQAIYKIWANIIPSNLLQTNNRFFKVVILNGYIKTFLLVIFVASMIIFFIKLLKTRGLIKTTGCLIAIPIAFYPFLLLPESNIMTYYLFPLIVLLLYFSVFFLISDKFICYFKKVIIYGLMTIIIINGLLYSNYWVKYNRDSYQFLRQSIENHLNEETKTIYVIGSIAPIVGGNPYVIFDVKNILDDIGKRKDDYNVVQTDTNYSISQLTSNNVYLLKSKLSDDNFKKVMSYYVYSKYYDCYYLKKDPQYDGNGDFMHECLVTAGLIPDIVSKEVAYIDLLGFNKTHKF